MTRDNSNAHPGSRTRKNKKPNKPWEATHPGIFHITDGTMATETLTGLGLSAVP